MPDKRLGKESVFFYKKLIVFTLTLAALVVVPRGRLAVMIPIAAVAIVKATAIIVRAIIHPAIIIVAIVVAPAGTAAITFVAWSEIAVAHFTATAAIVHTVHFIFRQGFLHIQLLIFDRMGFAHFIKQRE